MASEWYVAELVMEIIVGDDPRNVVHQNLVLIRANSADEAYEKALRFGKAGETSYKNPEGRPVEITFRGLADLDMIYDPLEDGAEVTFRYQVGMAAEEISRLVRPRNRLRAFLPPRPAEGPDYSSAEVIAEVDRQFGIKRPFNK